MSEMIERPPRTIMEVYKTLPEGTLAELIEGIIYMSPSPTPRHQDVLGNLFFEFKLFLKEKSGKVFLSPIDVFFDRHANAVQPDLVFILDENLSIINEDSNIQGVPDLIIEVLSSGNSDHDLKKKKLLYEKFGVKEYWIVDPKTKEAIGFDLQDKVYFEMRTAKGTIQSKLLQQTFEF